MKIDDWHGAYRDGWQGEIVPEAFAHPAKYSRSLIRRIFQHARDEGWLAAGSTVLDPFGGVALGALDAMHLGLNWCGIELEGRFQSLGQQNIARWNARYSSLPGWGTATILQGDSRNLAALVGEAAGCVSSPPFMGVTDSGKAEWIAEQKLAGRMRTTSQGDGIGKSEFAGTIKGYGTHPANLGNMRPGNLDACLARPPYASTELSGGPTLNGQGYTQGARCLGDYGATDGQLGAMPAGDVNAVISSPPYASTELRLADPERKQAIINQGRIDRGEISGGTGRSGALGASCNGSGYGTDPANLGNMKAGDFDACLASPPYGGSLSHDAGGNHNETYENPSGGGDIPARCYGTDPDNLGNATDFWTAARTIVEQVYTVLKPGAVAIWVLKDYVRDKKIVPFSDQWHQMCEACGFETLHVHRAWLVEEHGAQATLDGRVKRKRTERKSFFRRLSEAKAQAAKHWQDVSRTDRARHLWDAHRDLWSYYNRRMAEPIKAPAMPPPRPTRSRILSAAETRAWEEAGKPAVHIETRIDYEIVLCQVKPPGAASDCGQASACVSSPPHGETITYQQPGAGGEGNELMRQGFTVQEIAEMRRNGDPRVLETKRNAGYSRDAANLGNMPAGDFDAAVKPLNSNGKGDTQ